MASSKTTPEQKDTSYGCLLFLGSISLDNPVLLIRHNAGHWGFPKGHPAPDETPAQTAIRELREETGITPEEFHEEPSFTHHYTFKRSGINHQKTVIYFLATTDFKHVDIDEKEIKDYKWVRIDEVEGLIIDGVQSPVLLQLKEYLGSNDQ